MTVAEALNLAGQQQRAGDLAGAENLLRQITQQQPGMAQAHAVLGNNLYAQGRLEEAAESFARAAALAPREAEIRSNLGIVLFQMGRLEQAAIELQQACTLAPERGDIANNLAAVLYRTGDLDAAEAASRRALAIQPDSAAAYSNLAAVLQRAGRLDEAIAAYDQALALNPANPPVASGRIMARQLHPDSDSRMLLKDVMRWNHAYGRPVAANAPVHPIAPRISRRIRVGYVSSDFRDQVVGRNVLPLLREQDRSAFEIFCYSSVAKPDGITEQFKSHADGWRDVARMNDEQAAQIIRQDQIDILVDLSLHMPGNRLAIFARRAAAVQVTFAGYPGGTGLDTMDWRLTDPYLDPPGESDADYVEKSWRLKNSFWCYDPAAMEAEGIEITPLPALENGFVTFGCLNTFCKISDRILPLWKRIMQAVDRSRLVILAPPGAARQRFLQAINLSPDRVDFVSQQPRRAHLAEFGRIDLSLDTLPYNGHTTSLESLWMGVPVVSLIGRTVVGRAGLSQLSNLGLKELVAEDEDRFVTLAVDLAGDLERLAELRKTLRARMLASPLTDAKHFARSVEEAYRAIFKLSHTSAGAGR